VSQLLAERAAAGNLTSIYLHAQTFELQKKVGSVLGELNSLKLESGLEERAAKAKALANALNADLLSLSNSDQNPQSAGALQRDFANLLSQLMELENGLKPKQ
jgi:hypothetical protein